MKILLVNKFYYPRGGDCLVAMGIEQMLNGHNQDTAFFAMQYPDNVLSPWDNYFPSEISFSGGGLKGKKAAFMRLIGKDEVKAKFSALMDDFKPDVVHVHNIHSYLSPVVCEIAKAKGAKTIWTLHDYKLICPTYSFIRDGKVCELCLTNQTSVLTKKCMKGSLAASLLAYIESLVWNKKRLISCTDRFVSPSIFMKEKMMEGGFPENKIDVLPNFITLDHKVDEVVLNTKEEKSYCYIGRLAEEKGVELLLEVASRLEYKLYIAGSGPLLPSLMPYFEKYKNIIYLRQLSRSEVKELLQKVAFSVIPSVWYENNPLSVIESLCLGTPVLGANMGGIPELIAEGENGYLFEAGNMIDLQDKIKQCFSTKFDNNTIASKAIHKYSQSDYYHKLMEIFSNIL